MNAYAANKPVCETIVRARIEYSPKTESEPSLSPRIVKQAYPPQNQPHRIKPGDANARVKGVCNGILHHDQAMLSSKNARKSSMKVERTRSRDR